MKIFVAIKQVPDPNVIRFDANGNYSPNTPRVLNEYDQYAVEEAIQIKEARGNGEITVVSVGPPSAKEAITRALSMGADTGTLLTTSEALDAAQLAAILADEARGGQYDLILVGQESSDGGTGNVGPQLAALLDLPLVSNVVDLEISRDGSLVLQREVEDGRHVVEVRPPVVICALTGLNEPRSPSLKGIMAARRKPVAEKPAVVAGGDARVLWSGLRAEQRAVRGTIIQDTDAETAARQVVTLLRERKLI